MDIINSNGATVTFSGVRLCPGIKADLLLSMSQLKNAGNDIIVTDNGINVIGKSGKKITLVLLMVYIY